MRRLRCRRVRARRATSRRAISSPVYSAIFRPRRKSCVAKHPFPAIGDGRTERPGARGIEQWSVVSGQWSVGKAFFMLTTDHRPLTTVLLLQLKAARHRVGLVADEAEF